MREFPGEKDVLVDDPEARERVHVFADRLHAGAALARLIDREWRESALILAIPAGGVPVAAAMVDALDMPWDIAVVSKITLPYNSEVGYGAVAFDGTTVLNEEFIARFELPDTTVQQGMRATREKVRRRVRELRAGRSVLDIAGRAVILVDDGLASGFTMRAAVQAAKKSGVRRVAAAAPTASRRAVEELAPTVDRIFCPNVRSSRSFAVADAYERWTDVGEQEVVAFLKKSILNTNGQGG